MTAPRRDSRPFVQTLLAVQPQLYRRLLGQYHDEQLAEEVSWDCVTNAFERWAADPGVFDNMNLAGWMQRLATWRALDLLRARARHRPLPSEHGGEESPRAVLPRRQGEGMSAEDRELVWQALEQLPAADRDILTAHYFDGQTDQEVGTHLFGEDGTVEARGLRVWRRRRRAEARLRHHLIDRGIDPVDWGVGQAV